MDEIVAKIEALKTKNDFIEVVHLLIQDLQKNPDAWKNITLEDYLEALAAWTADIEGYYKNAKRPVPVNIDWKVFAKILVAASIYE